MMETTRCNNSPHVDDDDENDDDDDRNITCISMEKQATKSWNRSQDSGQRRVDSMLRMRLPASFGSSTKIAERDKEQRR
jgi:hypothetical protein